MCGAVPTPRRAAHSSWCEHHAYCVAVGIATFTCQAPGLEAVEQVRNNKFSRRHFCKKFNNGWFRYVSFFLLHLRAQSTKNNQPIQNPQISSIVRISLDLLVRILLMSMQDQPINMHDLEATDHQKSAMHVFSDQGAKRSTHSILRCS